MKIGFIGLGTMGASFASNLQKSGFDLVVHDLSRQVAEEHVRAGAIWADSPKAVAEHSETHSRAAPPLPDDCTAISEERMRSCILDVKPAVRVALCTYI